MNHKNLYIALIIIAVILVIGLFCFLLIPPKNFPVGKIIKITEGSSLINISKQFKDESIIKSPVIFQSIIILIGGDKKVDAGGYIFDKKLSIFEVVYRVVKGDYHLPSIKIVLPEGIYLEEIAEILDKNLPEVTKEEFLFLTRGEEGFLFPDTYFFSPMTTAKEVVKTLKDNFSNKVADLEIDISKAGKNLEEIITMASLIEKESNSNDYEEKRIVSGILWKRIEKNMLLQVDAVFLFLIGKGSAKLTLSDLEIDSPYNTYKYLGLPPGPIGNPGLLSIKASLYPAESPYFYYLHDKDGNIHYAENLDEHNNNKQKYLK
ncbi:hypothetical protein A2995_02065 [Candidatus Nomurabacteria bacterium RIFCSPLOWO2_01_FULL_33_24]|uniref:Endolytic murein transglycosylase n=1 Tax=Candidatus Nomurabacteria bacterium RIFCSPLOWO2_01_FULL_33_24 TaxID=1801765 RepID=A0A1F6WZ75_9BACT|nr:MAG: hypothetical protein A2995_02065 [Candidatus Nomurabacteria bacterium RIFCSPLOWO2_01_FULL_33_24]